MVIYKITNLVNGKVYIGQTIMKLSTRWSSHKSEVNQGRANYPLYLAMRKYGIDNFTIEHLASCGTREHLDILEEIYIEAYDCLSKNGKGYNIHASAAKGKNGYSPSSDTLEKRRKSMKNSWDSLSPEDRAARIEKMNEGKRNNPREKKPRMVPHVEKKDIDEVLELVKEDLRVWEAANRLGITRHQLEERLKPTGKTWRDWRVEYGFPRHPTKIGDPNNPHRKNPKIDDIPYILNMIKEGYRLNEMAEMMGIHHRTIADKLKAQDEPKTYGEWRVHFGMQERMGWNNSSEAYIKWKSENPLDTQPKAC